MKNTNVTVCVKCGSFDIAQRSVKSSVANVVLSQAANLLGGVLGTLEITVDIGQRETEGKSDDEELWHNGQRLEREEREEREETKDAPGERGGNETDPEETSFGINDRGLVFFGFKDPFLRAVCFEVLPPAKADKKTTGDVFNGPKIKCK